MNKKALYYGIAYSVVAIAFKLYILLGGYALSRFGYFYSNIIAVLLIIPFYILAIRDVRDNNYEGVISQKEGMRIALTIFAVAAILTSVYNYFEYQYSGKNLAIEYYNGQQFMDYLKARPNVKPEEYGKIIEEQIKKSEGSAF